jgi:ribosome-associated protein
LTSSQLATAIAKLSLTKKAQAVIIMDLRELSTVADYFVVCSADSDVQVKAIAEAVEEGMEDRGIPVWHREAGSLNWLIMDFVDVVLHVFHKNTRAYYGLEKLWGDAPAKEVGERPPSSRSQRTAGTRVMARRKPRLQQDRKAS